ncbi:hypothetical protein CKJ89_37695, partial [Klebsiella pneumoniae]
TKRRQRLYGHRSGTVEETALTEFSVRVPPVSSLEADERITAILPVREYEEASTSLWPPQRYRRRNRADRVQRPRSAGIIA